MHLCLIFLLCAVVYGVSRFSKSNLKAVNFAENVRGKKLNGSLIREVEVDSESLVLVRVCGGRTMSVLQLWNHNGPLKENQVSTKRL